MFNLKRFATKIQVLQYKYNLVFVFSGTFYDHLSQSMKILFVIFKSDRILYIKSLRNFVILKKHKQNDY